MFLYMVHKIVSIPISVLHYLGYGLLLCLFHPIQWVCIHWLKGKSHQKSVEILNYLLLKVLYISGNQIKWEFSSEIPQNVPLIFVPNHQSVYDIPPIIWHLRKFNPKFVGKKELDNGTPSIGINLKNNGSVLIDRNNPKKAAEMLDNFGKFLAENNYSCVIFPEGTRSRNGVLKEFKTTGLKAIIKHVPNGYLVPITINNSWKILRFGVFPIGLASKVNCNVHNALKISEFSADDLIEKAKQIIQNNLETNL